MRTIIFCRETLWDEPLRISTNSLARQFVKHGWRCAWVVNCVHPFHFLRPSARREQLWSLVRTGGRWVDGNVFEFCPLSLIRVSSRWPLNHPWFARHLYHLALPRVDKVLRREGFLPADVLVIGNPAGFSLIDLVPAKRVIFHAQDAFCDRPSATNEYRGIEAELIRRSDLVLPCSHVIARKMMDRYEIPDRKLHVVPHASDVELFAGEHEEPHDLRVIPRPRVAMLGTAATMDRDLLMELAERRGDLHFVSIGPAGADWHGQVHRRGLSNVHLLGPRNYEQLPGYLTNCDVGLAMYRRADVGGRIVGGFYMKIFDYAAAGLPIVVTEMPGYEQVKDFIFTAYTLDEFCEAIDRALNYTPRQYEKLRAFSRESGSWEARYRQIVGLLDKLDRGDV